MSGLSFSTGQVAVVVACYDTVVRARSTVRSAGGKPALAALVVDLDDSYQPVGDERVVTLAGLSQDMALVDEAARAVATLDPAALISYAGILAAQWVRAQGATQVLVLGAGVLLLGLPRQTSDGLLVVPHADADAVRRRATAAPVEMRSDPSTGLVVVGSPPSAPLWDRALFALGPAAPVEALRVLAADWTVAEQALELVVASAEPEVTVVGGAGLLLGPRRTVDTVAVDDEAGLVVGTVVVPAVDLTALDPRRPWILDPHGSTAPQVLLSRHPALADLVRAEAEMRLAEGDSPGSGDRRSGGTPLRLDQSLRSESRRADRSGDPLPDLLGLGVGPTAYEWALDLVPEGHPAPMARYLVAVRTARPDLVHTFPDIPGRDVKGLVRWSLNSGIHEAGYATDLLAEAADVTLAAQDRPTEARQPPSEGVNVVGYLTAESGLGESARQVEGALRAAGVPTSTFNVGHDIGSRRGATYRESEAVVRRTTLFCVNGAETAMIAPRMTPLTKRTRAIGMWYWETEDLPPGHLGGLHHVDEVWAASDFIRDAIARHSGDVRVVTVTPPLPQATDDPGVVPERFGIPEGRPWFLFTFDFLSFAARKNPHGLVEAFTRAFGHLPMEDRPLLVIKTINADRQAEHAEQLRLQTAERPDVLLLEAYLDDHERHVLVSHCTAYVSLHKAEGLGLTVAEAMAWGRPVITTAYGGVTQFCTAENSFLVRYERAHIPETIGPYVQGSPWAEPDLDHAAELMRAVIADPDRARTVGVQAARDIRELHNADVAGARMKEVLEAGDADWRARRAAARAQRQAERATLPGQSGVAGAPDAPPKTRDPGLKRRLRTAMSRRQRP